MPVPVQDVPLLKNGEFKVVEVKELSFFDLTGGKAKTKGTSNKSYHIELQSSTVDNKSQLFSVWGAVGASHLNEDWRHFDSEVAAKKEFDKIIKSKIKKGYVEIDVALRSIGSDDAKAIVKPVVFRNIDETSSVAVQSKLDPNVQNLVKRLFGATQSFVATTLKCPLGQLTNAQIDEGRKQLDEAKVILKNCGGNPTASEQPLLEKLTNNFYSLIPHNLGHGSRGVLNDLLFDSLTKVMGKESDLDTLLDAKSVGVILSANSAVDEQYSSLNADINHVDSNSELFKWINSYFLESRATNHGSLGRIKINNIWQLSRKEEDRHFRSALEKIAREYGANNVPRLIKKFVDTRSDVLEADKRLYETSNTLPVWHGTRTENLIGITTRGLLIRPAGAAYTGSLLGDAIYWAINSTKSINYTSAKGTYWAGGKDSSAFMFLADVAFGKQKIIQSTGYFDQKSLTGYHSVWAQAGQSLYNDELTTYVQSGPGQQHKIRYLLEFETKN